MVSDGSLPRMRRKVQQLVLGWVERLGAVRVVRAADYQQLLAQRKQLQAMERRQLRAMQRPYGVPAAGNAEAPPRDDADRQTPDHAEDDQLTRRYARQVAEFLMELLFATPADEASVDMVEALLMRGSSMKEVARALARHYSELRHRPAYAGIRLLLNNRNELPLRWRLVEQTTAFRIVDVGAEVLAYESHIYEPLVRSWPTVTLGFDPFSDQLQETFGATSDGAERKVTIVPLFIGSGRTATFRINKIRTTSSLYETNVSLARRLGLDDPLSCVEARQVETATLDSVLRDNADFAQSIDFLKVDVQGGTLEVLQGAVESLARTLVCHLEAEFSELYVGEGLFPRIDDFMRSQGFVLLDLVNPGRTPYAAGFHSKARDWLAGRLMWADCVYVRHLDELEKLGQEELIKLAVIAHELYQKYDVAAEALRAYEEATGEPISKAYAQSIR